jgi:peptide deformylase
MAVKKLNIYPHASLKHTVPNSEVSVENLQDEVKDLIDTLKHYEGHAFITANQIGMSKRIAVVDLQTVYNQSFKEEERYLIMVNPEIVELSKETVGLVETSIVVPDFSTPTTKSVSVKVKFDKLSLKSAEMLASVVTAENESSEAEVTVVKNKLDFTNFEFQPETITVWQNLAFVLQAAINQLDGKTYLDTVSWYNRERFLKKRKKTIKQFENWIKQSLSQTRLGQRAVRKAKTVS